MVSSRFLSSVPFRCLYNIPEQVYVVYELLSSQFVHKQKKTRTRRVRGITTNSLRSQVDFTIFLILDHPVNFDNLIPLTIESRL